MEAKVDNDLYLAARLAGAVVLQAVQDLRNPLECYKARASAKRFLTSEDGRAMLKLCGLRPERCLEQL